MPASASARIGRNDGRDFTRAYQALAASSSLHGTSPTTYTIDGRQHLLVPAGTTLTAWALN